ncbi:uncharacterized protein [Cherax quadricarinatus]|uniref:uncharacterized protein n=1 Tax=Cherax quadricarinatus TaxID=27406 RepID=UPI00387E96D3
MDSLDFWLKAGKEMGFTGQSLDSYITAKMAIEEKKEQERLAREEKKEQERLAREDKIEQERIAREDRVQAREVAFKMKEIELEQSRLELEAKKVELSKQKIDEGVLEYPSQEPNIRMPQIPPFSEQDDIAAYITRFESTATLCDWPVDSWATRLGLLLSGSALNVYSTLPSDVISSYSLLKKAILQAFKKTTHHYRSEFRHIKITPHQNYMQFLTTLFRLFDSWIDSAEVDHDFESLRDLMVRDQFLSSVNSDLRIFIKERNVHTAAEMAQAADIYACAHNNYPKERSRYKPVVPKQSEGSKPSVPKNSTAFTVKCFNCNEWGHRRPDCPRKKGENVGKCFTESNINAPFSEGTVNGMNVSTILRDTGCSCIVISSKLFPNLDSSRYKSTKLTDYLGRSDSFPTVRCFVRCKWFSGWVDAVVAPITSCSVLVGNIQGATFPSEKDCLEFGVSKEGLEPNISVSSQIVPDEIQLGNLNQRADGYKTPVTPLVSQSLELDNADASGKLRVAQSIQQLDSINVVTRAQSKVKPIHPLVLSKGKPIELSHIDLEGLQKTCPSLEESRKLALNGKVTQRKKFSYKFEFKHDLLYKTIVSADKPNDVGRSLLVIPQDCRETILKISHDLPVSGHFSHRKTYNKIKDLYFWPSMSSDIYKYCRSCHVCQLSTQKGRTRRVPMVKMPIFSVPFARVAVDIVGPITPRSSGGHKYILTMIDYASSFPEAVPLKSITSIEVAEALFSIFSRVGIPREILSDKGAQFTSELMEHVYQLVGVKPLFTTPYHPMCNGRVERQHAILKSILKKLCILKPTDWHRFLPCALFAMREIPSDSLGYSPFELLYGRQARGPLSILNELWSKDIKPEVQNSYQFLLDLRERLEETADLVSKNLEMSMETYKTYFDHKSSKRTFNVGDEVLVLLPDKSNKLLITWRGPYKVVKVCNKVDYILDVKGRERMYHVNILKRYHRREVNLCVNAFDEDTSSFSLDTSGDSYECRVCIIDDESFTESKELLDILTHDPSPKKSNVNINNDLSNKQKSQVSALVNSFSDVFTEVPGLTTTIVHKIELSDHEPVKRKVYPVPVHLRKTFDNEVDKLFNLNIIEPSKSAFCSPVVMVKKPDNSYRLAQDFRYLNTITKWDAEPMPVIDHDLYKFHDCKFFSELDISQAYHQVPLHPDSKQYTAFPTHRGLMQYRTMPFGLVTACATYIRLMRIVLSDLKNVSVYFDNIYIMTNAWEDHLNTLSLVLKRLRTHGLTVKPQKCFLGYHKVQYLGFIISDNNFSPLPNKTKAVLESTFPATKKLLRSFLGSVNFYRNFVPNLSSLTSVLTDYLKKGVKEPLSCSEEAIQSFEEIKSIFSNPPVLKLPDINKIFCLRTDASHSGLGAVLLQYYEETPFPVSFASKKLLPREERYSTVEKECYALVWGISRFKYYLYGKPFVLETDHKPLMYLENFKGSNSRLLRWALAIQPYKFKVVYISGSENHFSDWLSRGCI